MDFGGTKVGQSSICQWYIGGTERREAMSGLEALAVNNFRVVTITTIHF